MTYSAHLILESHFLSSNPTARAVQEFPSVLIMSDPTLLHDQEAKLRIQNQYLAFNITKNLLKAANLNGLQRPESRFTHEVINDPGFKDAMSTLEKTCLALRECREDEMGGLVSTLDITDAQLCANYKRVSNSIRPHHFSLLFHLHTGKASSPRWPSCVRRYQLQGKMKDT